ncbi:MAG: hypothetical protein A2284_09070 [Deltaproteobacteria bacterium RIFOXYA12_FULL_61_11]|nr:MAG: hypothetical protein A2284_09070 [Deltaproteobacteria bacterium RIFOXYA12_FULL_61_11]
MKICLFCQQGMGEVCLETLAGRRHEVVVFVPAAQFGVSTSLGVLAESKGWQVLPAPTLTEAVLAESLTAFAPDLLVSATYPERFPIHVLRCARFGGINLHPSLLPELRGQDPCFWAVRRGLRRSGLTIHRMDEQFDRGPVLAAAAFEVEDDDCGGSVYLKALGLVPGLLALVLEAFEGEDRPGLLEVEQPGEGSTAPRITSQRLRLHPELTVASALRLVRAANPFYGAWTVVQGRLLKVWQARAYLGPEEVPERMPGVALLNGTFLLKCRNGWIAPEIVQHAQYQVLDAELYCRKYVEKA